MTVGETTVNIPAVSVWNPETGLSVIGERIAAWVRRYEYKELARMLETRPSPRTVEGWADGQPPHLKHVNAMYRLWGPAFIADVFEAQLAGREDLHSRAERISADVFALRKALDETDPEGAARHRGAQAAGRGGVVQGSGDADQWQKTGKPRGLGSVVRSKSAAACLMVAALLVTGATMVDSGGDPLLRARTPRAQVVRVRHRGEST